MDLSLVSSVQIRLTCAPDSVLTNSLNADNAAGTSLFASNATVDTFVGVGTGVQFHTK